MNTLHKHAELIKAWADGANIQKKNKYTEYKWEDCIDTDRNTPLFGDITTEFRIKPETIKYRVALFNSGSVIFAACAVTDKQATNYENNHLFIRWLTEWVEVEV